MYVHTKRAYHHTVLLAITAHITTCALQQIGGVANVVHVNVLGNVREHVLPCTGGRICNCPTYCMHVAPSQVHTCTVQALYVHTTDRIVTHSLSVH